MTTKQASWLAATLISLAAPLTATAAVQEIPITTTNADAIASSTPPRFSRKRS